MHEIRLVGRGGQGVVTAGELLGEAAIRRDRFAQAIPTFGPERRGALSTCTLRIADEPILLKCSSTQPNVLLVFDPTIWHHAPVSLGLEEGSTLVFNTPRSSADVEADLRQGTYPTRIDLERCRVFTLDATGIALETIGRPITNTAMMGALTGATGVLEIESLEEVLMERFGSKGEMNVAAARTSAERIRQNGV